MKSTIRGRRKTEDRTAMIFLFITVIFISCHIPRIILDIRELINLDITNACLKAKMRDIVPAWTFILIYISHFCLVVNATLNMFVYGFMSTEFQKEVRLIVDKITNCFHKDVIVV